MLFDTTPKDERKDFFDRDEEIEKVRELKPPHCRKIANVIDLIPQL